MLQICQNIQNNGWKTGWIDDQGAPYVYGGDQWAGFDNLDSMKMKVSAIDPATNSSRPWLGQCHRPYNGEHETLVRSVP